MAAAPYGAAAGLAMAILLKAPCLRVSAPVTTFWIPAPQHELADRVGKAAVGHRKSLGHGLFGTFLIGGEEHLERCILGDLGIELALDPKLSRTLLPVFFSNAAEISFAASVKLAATAILISAAAEGLITPIAHAIASPANKLLRFM
jgi:hypothetical protein